MDSKTPSTIRVVMARRIAARWLNDQAKPEYRLKVFTAGTSRERRAMPNLLRSFRDGRIRLGSMEPIADLGVREEFDHFVLWSSNREALMKLAAWFEERNYETTGIW